MFRIGEFSRLAQVTIETLRHYDRVGLLKPAKVDPFTGYRLYSAKQLQPLNRILMLKELGFSLDEIARILQDNLTTEQLRGMLKAQLVAAESDVRTAESRRTRIEACLNYLNMEEEMSAFDITLKSVDVCTIASIREVVPTAEDMPQRLGAIFEQIANWMVASQLSLGPAVTMYHNDQFVQENFDTECGFIITNGRVAEVDPELPITLRQLEAVPQMATTVFTDDFYQKVKGLAPAYNAIAKWIEENDYQIVGATRELLYGRPGTPEFTAEIQFPVMTK